MKTINIVKCTGLCNTYYEDENHLLKGKWGGFRDKNQHTQDGKKLYWVYYSDYSKYVPITEEGLFYNKFSCEKYDAVMYLADNLATTRTFLCEKNGKYGLIDGQGKVLLHVVYNYIKWYSSEKEILLIKTETGNFLYDVFLNKCSLVYDEIIWYLDEMMIVGQNGLYGIVEFDGKELLPIKYEYNKYNNGNYHRTLFTQLKNRKYPIWIEDGKLYGMIEKNKYDECILIPLDGDGFNSFFIVKDKDKYGILNQDGEEICNSVLSEIYISKYGFRINSDYDYDDKGNYTLLKSTFIIGEINGKYNLYNVVGKGKCIVSSCEKIDFIIDNMTANTIYRLGKIACDYNIISFIKGKRKGYVTSIGKVIFDYDSIKMENNKFYIEKNGKKGILNILGQEIIPCKYDEIVEKEHEYIMHVDGEKTSKEKPSMQNYYNSSSYESQHYNEYGGYMGYSDEDIDTIFDGDPSAYWNID